MNERNGKREKKRKLKKEEEVERDKEREQWEIRLRASRNTGWAGRAAWDKGEEVKD